MAIYIEFWLTQVLYLLKIENFHPIFTQLSLLATFIIVLWSALTCKYIALYLIESWKRE